MKRFTIHYRCKDGKNFVTLNAFNAAGARRAFAEWADEFIRGDYKIIIIVED